MSKSTNAEGGGEAEIIRYPCPICTFSTELRHSLRRHMKLIHTALIIGKSQQGSRKPKGPEVIKWFYAKRYTHITKIRLKRMSVVQRRSEHQ